MAQKHRARAGARDRGPTATDLGVWACFFGSGFLALVYEICWIRQASLVFGAATFALSTVLAVFFGGLALGSYVFGERSPRTDRPLRVYAVLEMGVGLLALLSPWAFDLGDLLFSRIYAGADGSFAVLSLWRFVLVAVIVLPPTFLMGGTFPLLCRQYVRRSGGISRAVGGLYGLNTVGAAAGTLVCGFILIPQLGVELSLRLAGVANVLIGLWVWSRPLHAPSVNGENDPTGPIVESSPPAPRSRLIHVLFFLVGFVALGHEVLWARFLPLHVHNTVYVYTLTLAVILVGIVLGSTLASLCFDRIRQRAALFGGIQILSALSVLFILLSPPAWWVGMQNAASLGQQAWLAALVLLLPAVLSGAAFPLAIRMVVERPERAGIGVGRMTAINTLGGIVGSLVIGFLILPALGMQHTLRLTTGVGVLIGVLAWLGLATGGRIVLRVGMAVAAAALYIALPSLTDTRLPQDYLAPRAQLVDHVEGLSSHMAIVRRGRALELDIDRMAQGTNASSHQGMAAHIPMLLHPDPRRVVVVGLGPGQTAQRFLLHPLEQLDCVEIERGLVPLVRRHYESSWMDDPRVRFHIEDGRNFLSHTELRFDVISIEIGQVFRPGLAAFYTSDFYGRAKSRLAEGGVLCQFVPVGFFRPDEFQTVVRSFLEVFPESSLWYNTAELLMVGRADAPLRLTRERLALIVNDPRLHEDMDFAYWGGSQESVHRPEVFVASFLAGPVGMRAMSEGGVVYRDDRPHLEYSAAQPHLVRTEPQIVELIRRHVEPFAVILGQPLDRDTGTRAMALRNSNLGDIVARPMLNAAAVQAAVDPSGASALLQQAQRWNSGNLDVLRLQADLLIGSQQWPDALAALERVTQRDPRDTAAHAKAGDILLRTRQDPARALEHYRAVAELRPMDADAHNGLGVAYAMLEQPVEAERHLRRALELNPDHQSARSNLRRLRPEGR